MNSPMINVKTHIDDLNNYLLSTLDESLFFGELSRYLNRDIQADETLVYLIKDDLSAQLISRNGEDVKELDILSKGQGVSGQVVRTKRPYFSNNVQRDPIFSALAAEGIFSELCVPVALDGIVIATVHFRYKSANKEFKRETITSVTEILSLVSKPLTNMKMFLAAKFLNEALLRKIEESEKGLRDRESGLALVEEFKVEEPVFVTNNDKIKKILSIADKISQSDVSIIIQGRPGTGKESLAKRIHLRGPRSKFGFFSIDCSNMKENELEIEIFGIEVNDIKNGAISSRPGLLEKLNKGTLVLKDVSKLSLHMQAKMLSFIKDGLSFRVGGVVPFKSNVRIITTTKVDLNELVEKGEFRQDLLYCLNMFSIELPSLKDRIDDIEYLANHILNSGRNPIEQKSLSPGALSTLKSYNWSGNITELSTILERANILCEGSIIEKDHLPTDLMNNDEDEELEVSNFIFEEMTLEELEKRHICLTLDNLSGNKTKTAKALGITVKTLYNKLHSYGMIVEKEA